ncbi:hypothetical protein Hanom_Chr12g01163931 [Helianthus anomalus]
MEASDWEPDHEEKQPEDGPEEGEYRPPNDNVGNVDPPPEFDPPVTSPEEAVKESQQPVKDGLHGEDEKSPRVSKGNTNDVREDLSGMCNKSGAGCIKDGAGVTLGSLRNGGLNMNTPGPNSNNPLGKRNRDQRSPPSVGSVQGPQARYRQDVDNYSLDLNRSSAQLDEDLIGNHDPSVTC